MRSSTKSSTAKRSPSVQFIERFLSREGSRSKLTGLLLGQLDANNRIGTTFGHEQSEAFCAEYASRLKEHLPAKAPFIRLSDRRFAILVRADAVSEIVDMASDLAEKRQPQLTVNDDKLVVDVTIGIAVYPDHADDATSLFRRAGLALSEARANELSHEVYRPDATSQQAALWKFESELEQAIEDRKLEVYYQPRFDLSKRRVSGCEALVRWRAKSGNMISPDSFIPVAERTGCMPQLTYLVFDKVAGHMASWDKVAEAFSVSINISPQVLEHAEFFPRLDKLKVDSLKYGFRLILELTEDSLVKGGNTLSDKLMQIRESGVELAIDDFGKGYSSLTYLKDIPATEVKIDKRFIGTIATDDKDQHIVKAVVSLANAFGMRVVAEGVDNDESLDVVRLLGCESAQGFHIARPMRGDLLLDWLAAYSPESLEGTLDFEEGPLLTLEA